MTGRTTAPWGLPPTERLHSALTRLRSIYTSSLVAAFDASPAEAEKFARIAEDAACALILMRSLLGELEERAMTDRYPDLSAERRSRAPSGPAGRRHH